MCKQKHSDHGHKRYFIDYDLFKREGIHQIDEDTIDVLNAAKKPFFELIYKDKKPDSIIINNPYGKSPSMVLKVSTNDSVSVLETHYPFIYGITEKLKNYYVITNSKAIQYRFFYRDDACDIDMLEDGNLVGALYIYYPPDTINFLKKLLENEKVSFGKFKSSVYRKKLDKKLTLLSWVHFYTKRSD